ncbi:Uncharacterised protein [Edwardsiella hoshinae]|uniref:Uncharacterized protein n=1 Tax=Edwardsiella hoshinae TaxID=93378 RepID=A0A376D5M0_9GAMM|nr:Uncharacterised protein [Edwardsiella hoshinae]
MNGKLVEKCNAWDGATAKSCRRQGTNSVLRIGAVRYVTRRRYSGTIQLTLV